MELSCVHPCLHISRMKNCAGGSESIQYHQDTEKRFSGVCALNFHPQQTKASSAPITPTESVRLPRVCQSAGCEIASQCDSMCPRSIEELTVFSQVIDDGFPLH